jgi:hypothetical protein
MAAVPHSEDIPFSSSLELANLSVQIAGLARRHLDIISRSLEPTIYDRAEFVDVVQRMVVSAQGRASVRILVLNPEQLLSHGGHRLINLAMRVSSYIQIRHPGPDHRDFNEAMLLADEKAVIYRKQSERYKGIANFQHPQWAGQLAETFENLWQHAELNPNFRRLML